MKIFNIIVYILTTLAAASFFYKIFIQIKIKNPGKKIGFFSIVFRFYTLMDFIPLRISGKNLIERSLRKRANIAIYISYGCIVLALLLSNYAK
jgi:hypothetical protein